MTATSLELLRSDPGLRVHTNRNLRMASIGAIGFDMDHTLAVYNTDNFNRLCFELASERLISHKGYPADIRRVRWDPHAVMRGLVVDKRLGNLLKIDAHGHLTRVRHGGRFLDKEERRSRYWEMGRHCVENVALALSGETPSGAITAEQIDWIA